MTNRERAEAIALTLSGSTFSERRPFKDVAARKIHAAIEEAVDAERLAIAKALLLMPGADIDGDDGVYGGGIRDAARLIRARVNS